MCIFVLPFHLLCFELLIFKEISTLLKYNENRLHLTAPGIMTMLRQTFHRKMCVCDSSPVHHQWRFCLLVVGGVLSSSGLPMHHTRMKYLCVGQEEKQKKTIQVHL